MIFSDITNRTGIMQSLEDLTGTRDDSSYPFSVKTKDINLAFDDYQNLVKQVAGSWLAEDTNHTKYANMKFDLVNGQLDYPFTEDEQGNQVQDIYRVECMDADGKWRLLNPVDEMRYKEAISSLEERSGTPTEYYKSANGIFLCLKPNYTKPNGIRLYFTRSPTYFLDTDTSKEPGIPNGHHKYLFWKPAYWYWLPRDSGKANQYLAEVQRIEAEVTKDVSNRNRDEKPGFRPRFINYN